MVDGNGINRTSGSKRKRDDSSPERTGPRKAIKIKRQDSPNTQSHVTETTTTQKSTFFLDTAPTGQVTTSPLADGSNRANIANQVKAEGLFVAAGLGKKPKTTAHILNAQQENAPLSDFQNKVKDAIEGPPSAALLGQVRTVNLSG